MCDAAMKVHAPTAKAKFERAAELRKWADNYPQVQRSLRASFYNKALAEQVASRVEV